MNYKTKKALTAIAVIIAVSFIICNPTYASTYLYIWGGSDLNWNPCSAVYMAPVSSGGALGSWTAVTSLPQPIKEPWGFAIGDNIFSVAGITGVSSGFISNIYASQASSSGLISSWNTISNLPQPHYQPCVIVDSIGGYLCSIGGAPSNNAVYTAPFSGSTIGSWTTQPTFPIPVNEHSAVYDGAYIFVFGGQASSAVYSAPFSGGVLGTWQVLSSLPMVLAGHSAIYWNGYVYILGGINAIGAQSTVYSVQNLGGGNLGAWVTTTSLPTVLNEMTVALTGGYVYIIGGLQAGAGGFVNTVYSAPLVPGGVGSWSTTTSLPVVLCELSSAVVEFPETPTPFNTHTPTPTSTSTPQTPTSTPTCPMPCQTPPFFFVDRNIFNPTLSEVVHICWNLGITDESLVAIYNSAGELIRKLDVHFCFNGSLQYAVWDGKNYNGNIVTNNVYIIKVSQGQFLRYAKVAVRK